MHILAVQNYEGTGLGLLGQVLAEQGARIDLRRPDKGDALPVETAEHDALVVLGGAQNALDDAHSPYFPQLLALARAFEAAGKASLGICLGAQLLARAFGGQNRIGGASEFGWQPVSLTSEGQDDPLTASLPQSFPIFQWHDDTFGLPPGATRLAGSAKVENQAFRFGRATYGVQFHFEADRALVEQWSQSFASVLADSQPGWDTRRPEDAATFGVHADAAGRKLAEAWIALI